MKTKNKTAISTLIAVTVAFSILVAFVATASADAPPCICGDICVNEAGWWRAGGDFNASNSPIQHATDNASAGDTICVKDGTYNENVNVNVDNLTIRSENGSASTIVNVSNPNDHVFEVTAGYVNIFGFTVTGATHWYRTSGICLDSVNHCNISENNATNNHYGIYLYDSSNNTLASNTACSNNYGILLDSSSNNTLTGNTAYSNDENGIHLSSSGNNTLTSNTAYSNKHGIWMRGSSNNTLTSNTAYNNSFVGIYLRGSSNNTLTSNTACSNDDGIYLCDSSNYNTLTNNIVYNNSVHGIHLDRDPSNNVLINNIVYNSSVHGIYLHYESDNNNITSNIVYNNSDSGIHVDFYSSNNMLTNNTAYSNNYGIYLRSPGSNNNNLTSNTAYNNSYYGIYLWGSNNNNLTNNTANENSKHGIYLYSSSYNMLSNNIASNNQHGGIYLEWYSSNNNLTGNTINANNEYGIYLLDSKGNNNLIYNNYFNNTNNTRDEGNNIWNITKTAGTNIISGPYLGGNYWSDYSGEDTNEDGIGNTQLPYNSSGDIVEGGDWLPLTPTNVSVETSTGTGTATFSTDSGQFAGITGVAEGSLPQEAKDNKPEGLTLPHGLFNFTITGLTPPGQSVTLTITLPSPVPMGSLWWKVNTTAENNTWYSLPIGSDNGDNVVTITLTDGGPGDNDGVVNGIIVDPSGIGIPSAPPASISNLTNITGQRWINWTWNNPPDADFNYTMVFLNGTWQTNTSDPFYNATGLVPDTDYEIGTHTVDKVGNINTTWVNQTTKTQAPSDLIINDTWVCWPDNCTICYNITNIGNGTALAGHNTTLYVDGEEVADDYISEDLAPNASYIGCFEDYNWTYTPPSDNITVCADNNETVEESNETNNCLTNIWKCGDVNEDGRVTMSDVRKVYNRYLDPSYSLCNEWAGDVNCDGIITMSDVRKVYNRYLDPSYDLNCCCEQVIE